MPESSTIETTSNRTPRLDFSYLLSLSHCLSCSASTAFPLCPVKPVGGGFFRPSGNGIGLFHPLLRYFSADLLKGPCPLFDNFQLPSETRSFDRTCREQGEFPAYALVRATPTTTCCGARPVGAQGSPNYQGKSC